MCLGEFGSGELILVVLLVVGVSRFGVVLVGLVGLGVLVCLVGLFFLGGLVWVSFSVVCACFRCVVFCFVFQCCEQYPDFAN